MKKQRPDYFCQWCGKQLEFRGHSYSHKFCNHDCFFAHKQKTTFDKWSREFEIGNCHHRPRLKQILTELRGYACEVCGISEWNNKELVLQVDHINGDSENNMPSNVRLICPNCHSQTNTFAGANRGKGRWSKEGWKRMVL